MTTSELDTRNIAVSMRKSVENLVISSQDAIGQSISQAVTFSGIITQHNNIQETRNVSRSPSPSLRGSEAAVEVIENDKGGEMAIHVPSHPAADTISVSSANSIAPANALAGKNDIGKVTSPNASARSSESGGGGGVRTKKKSWYNSLYPTYKSKSDDFKRLFKDLPDDERLIVDYSCALQKDILAHGRLYASQNYLCFYANIFGWETNVSLRWKDVTAITKEKTALVIPNAILICTEGEKNFLTSFSGRDKAYLMLFRIWQNALMDQPMSSQEIWQWVHSCYGEELGFNSDDEGYGRDFTDYPVSALPSDAAAEDILDTSSIDVSGGGDGREHIRPSRSSQGRDSSPPLVENGDGVYREEPGDTLPTDMSDSTDSEPDKHHNPGESEKCSSPHEGKVLLRGSFPFNIDQLFTMIFTNSKFSLELLAARGSSDYVQAPWQPQAGLKCRQISYTLGLTSGPIGPKEVQVTETQVMNKCSKPGMLYSIDCSSENAGIPYADYFTVEVHYCLQRRAESSTHLQIFCQVKYKKSMWPMVKAFLEKSAFSGTEDYVRLLEARLAAEADVQAPAKRKGRRPRRATSSSQDTTPSVVVKSPTTTLHAPRTITPRAAPAHTSSWLLGILLLLLLINALLYWRLYYAERQQYTFDLDDLQNRLSSLRGAQTAEWARLLEQHSVRQRGQLLAWRDALANAVSHLAHTEQALTKLLESIKPSLERAQKEASEHSEL